MNLRKELLSITSIFLTLGYLSAQQAPTSTNPTNAGTNDPEFWSRAGNGQVIGTNNIFGTRWNSPIYYVTGGGTAGNSIRMKLNGELSYTIDNYVNQNKTGFLGLGDGLNGGNNRLWEDKGPFSLLHLNGRNQDFFQESGYRPWMNTGITFTDNQDFMYFGTRAVPNPGFPNGYDLTEQVLAWSDNAGGNGNPGIPGPDHFVLRFTGRGNGNTNLSNNLRASNDIDGRHIARFTGQGLMGLGNTFGVGLPSTYVLPQSLLHLSFDRRNGTGNNQERFGFMQITYRDVSNVPGTGETRHDGLRFGIDNQLIAGGLNSYLRWQENTPFIVQTDWDNSSGGIQGGERMRISSINSPSVPDPSGPTNSGNITRVSISEEGNNPITQPRSLLHLGYNTAPATLFNFTGPNPNDGWRSWMDVGIFTSEFETHLYTGIKGKDAIIAWGEDDGNPFSQFAPSHLRFVFTETNGGTNVSNSVDGLEIARFDKGTASTLASPNDGMLGIGDFSPNGPNPQFPSGFPPVGPNYIDAKLDIDGDLRIRQVTQNDSLDMILVVNPSDLNRVHWRDASTFGATGVNANNGCSMDTFNDTIVQFGQDQGLGITGPAQLLDDREVPMRSFNIDFLGTGVPGGDLVSFGQPASTTASTPSKIHAFNDHENVSIEGYTDATNLIPFTPQIGVKGHLYNPESEIAYGVWGVVEGLGTGGTPGHGVYGESSGTLQNNGVTGFVTDAGALNNRAGNFRAQNGQTGTYGLDARAISSSGAVIGVRGNAGGNPGASIAIGGDFFSSSFDPTSITYGVKSSVSGGGETFAGHFEVSSFSSGTPAIGIYAAAGIPTSPGGIGVTPGPNYAGYFNGDVNITGVLSFMSDRNLKKNVEPLTNASELLEKLNPTTYDFKTDEYSQMNLPGSKQYGLISQEVQQVIPELVKEDIFPAQRDSLGNITHKQVDYLGLSYQGLIPILVQGHKEQQERIEELEQRMLEMEALLSNRTDEHQNSEEITLSDGTSIVLEQNVPNPFAERTSISFSIPSEVTRAQILFHDASGKLINSMDIEQRGNGSVNVFASDLSNGVYTYTLLLDGNIVASKKMVKN